MEFCDFVVKKGTGKNTILDKQYTKLINNVIKTQNDELEERWEMYNLIVKELFNVDGGVYFQEIKYRLTDGENPNNVILEIISRYRNDTLTFLIGYCVKKVEEYAEEDFYKRFYE
jgi:hypothetical protein